VGEGRVVLGSPGELGADTGHNLFFVVGVGGEVTDFLLHGLHALNSGAELDHLLDGHLLDVANVVHHFHLGEVTHVVSEVELEVPLHGDVKSLHLFGGTSASGDGGVNGEGGSLETVVFSLELVDDVRGVDDISVFVPLDFVKGLGSLRGVVVVEDRAELGVGLTSLRRVSGSSKTSQPVSG